MFASLQTLVSKWGRCINAQNTRHGCESLGMSFHIVEPWKEEAFHAIQVLSLPIICPFGNP
jgi:hypothetical protein